MAIEFFTTASTEPVIAHLALTISRHLAMHGKVLWLVSGGSAIKIAVETAKKLDRANINSIDSLTVSLVDERYGPAGHQDSNWQQLMDAGFDIKGATLQPVLTNLDLAQTTRQYNDFAKRALNESDFKLALVGIGPDGHTLGIKAHSPAVKSRRYVCGYKWEDYVRLTFTPAAIAKFDEIVAYAVGREKHKVLELLDKNLPAEELPAQFLKQAKKLTVYNDYKGDQI